MCFGRLSPQYTIINVQYNSNNKCTDSEMFFKNAWVVLEHNFIFQLFHILGFVFLYSHWRKRLGGKEASRPTWQVKCKNWAPFS